MGQNLPSRVVQGNQKQSSPVGLIRSPYWRRRKSHLDVSLALNILQTVQWIDANSRKYFCSVCTEFVLIVSSSEYVRKLMKDILSLTLRTASMMMFMLHCLAASQALRSSSLVPHLVATEPFWSNSPRSHYTNVCMEENQYTCYGTSYQIISVISNTSLMVNLALSILHTAEPLTLTGFIPLFGGGSQI
jgi:hypothetical protein